MTGPSPSTVEVCRQVRTTGGTICGTHREPWPCRVREQPGEQLAFFHAVSRGGPRIVAEVLAERMRQIAMFPPEQDDERLDAFAWLDLLATYLDRAAAAGTEVADAAIARGEPVAAALDSVEGYRRRLVQISAIAIAAIEAHDRITGRTA